MLRVDRPVSPAMPAERRYHFHLNEAPHQEQNVEPAAQANHMWLMFGSFSWLISVLILGFVLASLGDGQSIISDFILPFGPRLTAAESVGANAEFHSSIGRDPREVVATGTLQGIADVFRPQQKRAAVDISDTLIPSIAAPIKQIIAQDAIRAYGAQKGIDTDGWLNAVGALTAGLGSLSEFAQQQNQKAQQTPGTETRAMHQKSLKIVADFFNQPPKEQIWDERQLISGAPPVSVAEGVYSAKLIPDTLRVRFSEQKRFPAVGQTLKLIDEARNSERLKRGIAMAAELSSEAMDGVVDNVQPLMAHVSNKKAFLERQSSREENIEGDSNSSGRRLSDVVISGVNRIAQMIVGPYAHDSNSDEAELPDVDKGVDEEALRRFAADRQEMLQERIVALISAVSAVVQLVTDVYIARRSLAAFIGNELSESVINEVYAAVMGMSRQLNEIEGISNIALNSLLQKNVNQGEALQIFTNEDISNMAQMFIELALDP